MINETKYKWKEKTKLSKNNESFEYYNHFLWKESPPKIKENLSWALAILSSDKNLINKITCNSWDKDNNIFLIWQLWQKKKKKWLLWNRESKKIQRLEKQKQKTPEELRENYCAVCSNKEIKELENVKFWILKKEEKSSYTRDINYVVEQNRENKYTNWDEKLRKDMKKFQLDNIMFNHVMEHVIRDLVEDIIKTKWIEENMKIIKTNEYDDVNSNTDYIIEADLGNGEFWYKMIDITTITDEERLHQKEDKSERPILFDYSTVIKNKATGKRDVWSIDKNFAFNLTNNYINLIKKGEKVWSGECLEMAKKISESSVENIKNNISSSISDVIKN